MSLQPEIREDALFCAILFLGKIPPQEKLLVPLVEILLATCEEKEADNKMFTEQELEKLLNLCKRAGIENYSDCKDLLRFGVAKAADGESDVLGRKLRNFITLFAQH